MTDLEGKKGVTQGVYDRYHLHFQMVILLTAKSLDSFQSQGGKTLQTRKIRGGASQVLLGKEGDTKESQVSDFPLGQKQ